MEWSGPLFQRSAFKPLRLGEVDLKTGRGELTLRALKMPGKQVMEVRSVFLALMK